MNFRNFKFKFYVKIKTSDSVIIINATTLLIKFQLSLFAKFVIFQYFTTINFGIGTFIIIFIPNDLIKSSVHDDNFFEPHRLHHQNRERGEKTHLNQFSLKAILLCTQFYNSTTMCSIKISVPEELHKI